MAVALEGSQWVVTASAASTHDSSLLLCRDSRSACCSARQPSLVSRVTALVAAVATLVAAITRVTAPVSSVAGIPTALVPPSLVLLVIVLGGVLLRVALHLLTVVKVLPFGLDEFVGFAAGESGDHVFGKGVVFRDT